MWRSPRPVATQWRQWSRLILLTNALAMAALGVILLGHLIVGTDLMLLTADAAALNASPVAGVLSNAGIIVWASGAAVAIFGAWVLPAPASRYFWGIGLLTAFLVVDDTYMLHDWWLPEIGVSETIALAMIGLGVAGFMLHQRERIGRSPWLILAIAVAGLTVMIVLDLLEHSVAIPMHHLWEEGAKFVGIMNWSAYLVALTAEGIRESSPALAPASGRGVLARPRG